MTWKFEDRGIALQQLNQLNTRISLLTTISTSSSPNTIHTTQEEVIYDMDKILSDLSDNDIFCCSSVLDKNTYPQLKQNIQTLIRQATSLTIDKQAISQTAHHILHENEILAQIITKQNTRNIKLMRIIRIGLFSLIALLLFTSFFLLKKNILKPLNTLKDGFNAIKKGQFDTAITINTKDEWEEVALGFNQMVRELHNSYSLLENRVKLRTQELENEKNNKEILYQITSYLHENELSQKTLYHLLHRIQKTYHTRSIYLFLMEKDKFNLKQFIPSDMAEQNIIQRYCHQYHHTLKTSTAPYIHCTQDNLHFTIIFIKYKKNNVGLLVVNFNTDDQNTSHTLQLLKPICDQLAVAQENKHLHEQQKDYAILSERNLIAQRLHDSIAQSLAFLNMQIQSLKNELSTEASTTYQTHIEMIEKGIQHCHEDIRLLLNNFRAKLNYTNLQEAVKSIIQQYQQRYHFTIDLQWSDDIHLHKDQQLQVIFILQEALSNIAKHAKASHITIHFKQQPHFMMEIKDNGIGFELQNNTNQPLHYGEHIGLAIMKERSEHIGAKLQITSAKNQGTCIQFSLDSSTTR
ncbi:ATP-binding protein [Pelistega ratti]|uniref:ATP-binding protein n=1 Tax=Pelistega ratti TaxID=2652177 RepID=UPI00135A730E|nr:ATP-binding protein [Pelistega ratti]